MASKSTTAARLERTTRAPLRMSFMFSASSRWVDSLGHGREHEEERARGQDLLERRRHHARLAEDRVGQPGVVAADHHGPEGLEQGQQLAPDVAEAEDAHLRAAQQDRISRAGEDVALTTLAEGAVLTADAAGEIDGQAQRELGHCLRIDGRTDDDVDASLEGSLVVDVLEEVALDVEDAAQPGRSLEAVAGQVRLADDGEDLGQAGLDGLLRRVGLAIDDGVALVQAAQGVVAEDALDGLRRGTQQDDGLLAGGLVGHGDPLSGVVRGA